MIVCGITKLARRLLDVNNPDLVWLSRARRGADDSRAAHSVRESVKAAARRLVRCTPTREAPWVFCPGVEALGRPAADCNTAEPQAEPSDVLWDKVAVSNADPAPHASKGDSGQYATSPPNSEE